MGKEFLVKDSLPNLKWKMEGETRVIGGYNCFKATAIRPVSKTDFRNFAPKKEESYCRKTCRCYQENKFYGSNRSAKRSGGYGLVHS